MVIATMNPWEHVIDLIYEILTEAQALEAPLLDPDVEVRRWDPDPKTEDYISIIPGLLDRAGQPHGLNITVKVGRQSTDTEDASGPGLKITERLTQVLGLVDTFARNKRIRVLGVTSTPTLEREDEQAEFYWVGYINFTLATASGR